MKNKKILINLSIGLVTTLILTPLTLSITSCAVNENPNANTTEDSKYQEHLGKNVSGTDKEGVEGEGILVRVEDNKIGVDSSNIKEFSLPLDTQKFTIEPDQVVSKNEAVSYIAMTNHALKVDHVYLRAEEYMIAFLYNLPHNAKFICNEMLTIFKGRMSTGTYQKLDEAILDLIENNKLKKLKELINYYVNTFVGAREEFFIKCKQLQEVTEATINQEYVRQISYLVGSVSDRLHESVKRLSSLKISE